MNSGLYKRKDLPNVFSMQVTFSAQSLGELEKMNKMEQIAILGRLGDMRPEQFYDSHDPEVFGKIHRQGKTLYRIRIGDLRFYFEFRGGEIFCHYILPSHSFEDFCFRCGLTPKEEPQLENEQHFWQFLETKAQPMEEAAGGPVAIEKEETLALEKKDHGNAAIQR